jgi:hypothetical protein
VTLIAALRASGNPWARRIVRRQGYRLLLERGPFLDPRGAPDLEERLSLLAASGIDGFITLSRGILATYGREAPLWVRTPRGEVPIADYTPLYERYAEPAMLSRLYVPPERFDEARRLATP